ncbi:MAG TPA: type IV toxin-antitoxin system AbiEi family antitoxin domain-containing protein [Thermoanaerobaculia bacterium]|nr:type IV toxin-antitoxin system AbiEi family antitoxin domain-containing protein [Thermoanaerobaculia bacterium]
MPSLPTFRGNPWSQPLSLDRLRQHGMGAFFRPSELRVLGVRSDQLRTLVQEGTVERVGRGLYRLTEAETTEDYSLAAVCARVPESIVCLLSALQVHDIGTRVPAEVWLAIPHKARAPRLPEVRVRIVRFSGAAWTYGIVATSFEGVPARITSPARTVVDCFRYERLVGRETALEALYDGLRQKKVTTDSLYRTLEMLPSRRLRAALEAMP